MSDSPTENSLQPTAGWHCTHLFYRFDRRAVRDLSPNERSDGCREFLQTLDAGDGQRGPARLQTLIVSGHKADFGLVMLDPHPLMINGVHQRLMSGPFGSALVPTWSMVSMTEVSDYVPTVEQYAQRLIAQGVAAESEDYRGKVKQYERRLEIMRRQRLTPDLPNWPAVCFYPMNKKRATGENWFLLPFEERERLMSEHGQSGMKFAGKVTQLVTVGIGLGRLGMGRDALGPQSRVPQGHRLSHAVRRGQRPLRRVRTLFVGYQAPPGEILKHCLGLRS